MVSPFIVHKFPALALFILATTPLAADEVVLATALPRVTVSELAAMPFAEPGPRVYRHRPIPPVQPGFVERASMLDSAVTPATATIAAPPVTVTFDSDTSRNLSPADAAGAVGPRHVLSVSNSRLIVHDRTGKVLQSIVYTQFWKDGAAIGEYYDPRAEYDAAADRYVVMAIQNWSAIMLAVSETGDPAGAWRRYRVPMPDVDFSLLALTRDTILFGGNITSGGDTFYNTVASVDKAVLYAHPESLTVRLDVLPFEFVMPVATDRAEEWIASATSNRLSVKRFGEPEDAWRNIDAPAEWRDASESGWQLGGPFLEAGYGVLEDAVERDGFIYVAMTRNTPGRQSLVWCRFDPLTLQAEWGVLADPEGKIGYAYPSLAVNRHGSMLIGFATFSLSQYPSSGFIYRDFLGRTTAPAVLRAGETPVVLGGKRWGDYTTTVVDPLDDASFWTVQIHAKADTWLTSWAKIEIGQKRRAARH